MLFQVENVEQSFDLINSKPKPLAAYLFSNNEQLKTKFVNNVSAGGMLVNDTILHVSWPCISFSLISNSLKNLLCDFKWRSSLLLICCNIAGYYSLQFLHYRLGELGKAGWDAIMEIFPSTLSAIRSQFSTEVSMQTHQSGTHHTLPRN